MKEEGGGGEERRERDLGKNNYLHAILFKLEFVTSACFNWLLS